MVGHRQNKQMAGLEREPSCSNVSQFAVVSRNVGRHREWEGRQVEDRGSGTAHSVVFGRVQRVQKVEETLNEFKRTRLVGRRIDRKSVV